MHKDNKLKQKSKKEYLQISSNQAEIPKKNITVLFKDDLEPSIKIFPKNKKGRYSNNEKQSEALQKVADLNNLKCNKYFPIAFLLIHNRIVINRKKLEESLKEVKSLKNRRK